jgi:hypothetical protein
MRIASARKKLPMKRKMDGWAKGASTSLSLATPRGMQSTGASSAVAATLTSLLILALECGDDEAAWSIYQSHHKAPLDRVPNNKRQVAGPQHLLGLTSRAGVDPSAKDRLLEALKSFTMRARHWDKRIDPVPYISIVPLTRILVQCLRRLDKPPIREELWALLR